MWKLNKTFPSNKWVKKEITRKIGKYFDIKKNEDTAYQNLWNLAKLVFGNKFIPANAYIKKEDFTSTT